jgi:hypothetical protein
LRTFWKPVEQISKDGFLLNMIFEDISKICRANSKGRIFMKFDIWWHLKNLSRKFQRTDFYEIWYLRTFKKPVEQIPKDGFSWNLIFEDISKTCGANFKGRIFMKFDVGWHFENLSSKFQRTDFHEIWYLRTFRKLVEQISKDGFSWNVIFEDISKICRGNFKGRIFMKFYIWCHFENLSRKFQKTDFHKIWYMVTFWKSVEEISMDGFSWNLIFEDISKICRGNSKLYSNMTRTTGILHEDLCKFKIICPHIIFRMRNDSTEVLQTIETHI